MTEFEKKLGKLRHVVKNYPTAPDVPAHGLLAIAEGLAEIIETLRPVVTPDYCFDIWHFGIPGGAVHMTTCARPKGHDGKHANAHALYGGPDGVAW